MLDWIKKRIKEPTTYLGVGLLANSAMVLTKADPVHTEIVTGTIAQVAEPLASGNYTQAIAMVLGGLMGIFMKEGTKD